MDQKYVYFFNEGNATMSELLGRKGANLAEMVNLNLPVPAGFTITTEACRRFYEEGKQIHPVISSQIEDALATLEQITGKAIGHPTRPLLVSVRSGSSISMPGMMDTILNLGMNDKTAVSLADNTGNPSFAYDSYRRFIQMFSDIVLNVDGSLFEAELTKMKERAGVVRDSDLSADQLFELVHIYKMIVAEETEEPFPEDPIEQLMLAIGAVFDSWYNQRAMIYRRIHKIPDHLGTAVTIQEMVFGNCGDTSGTGIAFSRHPSTGSPHLFGEFLLNAQGEDIVAGIRTPETLDLLKETIPRAYQKLTAVAQCLEKHYRDIQDIEFTVENNRLFLLQTRSAKRTAEAAIKVVVDMANENLISREEALMRVDPAFLCPLMQYTIDPQAELEVIGSGMGASSGAATGIITFDAEEAERLHRTGLSVILVRPETTPEDIHGMVASDGILTVRGGVTSHAAVVARDLGKPAIVGCGTFIVDLEERRLYTDTLTLNEGDVITICGSTGRVINGEAPLVPPTFSEEFRTLLMWANEVKILPVLGSVNTPKEARLARKLGAEGVGLCRTEQMFKDPHRRPVMTKMMLSRNQIERRKILNKLIPMQRKAFLGIFREMEGRPVTIRLIDPPLHEFLPNAETLTLEIERASVAGNTTEMEEKQALLERVKILHESNPAFGHRGCRLGITYPEIYECQTQAIAEAALELKKEGIFVYPRIIVPLLSDSHEMQAVRENVQNSLEQVFTLYEDRIDIPIGAFLELPRACLTADKMAAHADFFVFGTNDLTQSTYGFSRDDAEGKYLAYYLDHKILADNPFVVLDQEGVGELIKVGVTKGRLKNPDLKIGVCGDHTSEKHSVEFLQNAGLDFISCLPHKIPIARISAAQAAIKSLKRG
ncbi:pyruvate, phosphate dikinase [Aneurinibacillus terranovensis]|uniref:pyruvate, phosphate dikinase n=1 Tax=Aneurinibacillus terranovensis TaxID=278991 RepID=UPI0003FC95B2|nr:pyruvate, phosphate dikinase [Aneurinibacillus terranovensis]